MECRGLLSKDKKNAKNVKKKCKRKKIENDKNGSKYNYWALTKVAD